MNLVSKQIKVKLTGPTDIAKIVHAASASTQCVFIQKGEARVDAKSILGVFTLGIKDGDEVTIISEDSRILEVVGEAAETGE
ncbi:MAG: HPr component phosphorylation site [Bacillales bacterium]|jgi:phosphotransferase system HPr (HPr) family protein|nr:HPr component phosphorylation site [Bacillales bacterium]